MTIPPRTMILRARTEPGAYEGMDRPRIGECELPEALMFRGFDIEDLAPAQSVAPWRELLAELDGYPRHELIALGELPGPAWERLGFDVGEVTERAWSAIVHRDELLPPEEAAGWSGLLNHHGLFAARDDAERFLARYRTCDDPDGGWFNGVWTDSPPFYDVVPIHRLRRSTP